jgi:cytochrome b
MSRAPAALAATSQPVTTNTQLRVRIWDAPVRIVHWSMVACVGVSWWAAENRMMDWHLYSGYALLGLLIFRLYWGFAGSDTARFANFLHSPRATWRYVRTLKERRPHPAGHNPLGGWGAIALLGLLLLQVGLGLFAVDVDGLESGPLSYLVSFETGRTLADRHEQVFDVLLVMIGLHIAAALAYLLLKRENLIGAMVSGRRLWSGPASGALRFAANWRVWPGVLLAAAVVWYIGF